MASRRVICNTCSQTPPDPGARVDKVTDEGSSLTKRQTPGDRGTQSPETH